MNNYLIFFISIAIINVIIKIWLNIVNKNYILQHREHVPDAFVEKTPLDVHQKAVDYSVSKINFSNITIFYHFLLLMMWIPLSGLNFIDSIAQQFGLTETLTGLCFFALYSMVSGLLTLPESLYQTFVLEQKYGFNKTTPKLYLIDLLKQLVLGIIIAGPIFYLILEIMQTLGKKWWIYAWALIIGFQFIMLWAYPKFIAPLFNKFSKLENADLQQRIENLSKKIHINFRDYYVMNASIRSSHGNAYFTGLGKNKRIVFFDTLLKTLNNNEVEAVLAHELGHLKHKHILKSMIISIFFTFIGFGILGILYGSPEFYAFHNARESSYMALMLFSFITPVYTFIFTPIQAWLSRKNEYQADKFACDYSDGNALIDALIKMYNDNSSCLTPNPIYSKFYYSHPPALERVAYIKSCQA